MSRDRRGISWPRALRSLSALLAIACWLGVAPAAHAAEPSTAATKKAAKPSKTEPLRIVFIAYQNPDQLIEDVGPVVEYLEQQLGRKVKTFAATDYAGVVEALRNDRADVGFMGPLQAVLARREAGAIPLLGEVYNGSPTYRARIFVRKDSGIRSPADLSGRTVAFTDPISSSGYLYPLQIFHDAKLIRSGQAAESFFGRVYFAGGDEQALRAVLNGFVDAAGIGQYSYSLLRPAERDQITFIAESKAIPSHCVVVRRGLPKAEAEALKSALLALNDGKRKDLLRHLYNVDGYVEVDASTYAEVEALARARGLLE